MARNKPAIGEMDQRVSVLSFEKTRGLVNEGKTQEQIIWSGAASFRPLTVNERASWQVVAIRGARFVIRSSKGSKTISPRHHIRHEGAVYGIKGIQPLGRERFLVLICEGVEGFHGA